MEGVFAPVDYVVLVILGIALLRGLLRGLLREAFSVAALAAAVVTVMLFYANVAEWLLRVTQGRIGEIAAPYVAGALIAIATIGVTALAGRVMRRGARAAGLGWADRAGGAALGVAEGLLVAGVLVSLISYVGGPEHPILVDSRSLEVFQEFERFAQTGELPEIPLPDVAAAAREATEARIPDAP
jgi:membrane protein required for colicin V production